MNRFDRVTNVAIEMDSGDRGSVGPNDEEGIVYRFKLVVLGMSRVGKTSLLMRLMKNHFSHQSTVSLGAVYHTHTLNINDQTIKLNSKY